MASRRALGQINLVIWLLLVLSGCSGASKLDYLHPFGRTLWQRPELVVEKLEIEPGAQVADIGAGDGYFVPYLSRAVGPEGHVWAVDVDEEAVQALEDLIAREGLANVSAVRGGFGDPLLPDGGVDRILIVNTYHHIESRVDYFARLRDDLRRNGRVAILEPNEELGGVLSLFLDEGHTSLRSNVRAEMIEAGYENIASPDVLAVQIFEVFAPAPIGANPEQ